MIIRNLIGPKYDTQKRPQIRGRTIANNFLISSSPHVLGTSSMNLSYLFHFFRFEGPFLKLETLNNRLIKSASAWYFFLCVENRKNHPTKFYKRSIVYQFLTILTGKIHLILF